ncbi:MAG: terminase small subunit [Clostridia bacterium]
MAGKLNERQKRFADEYLIDLNATQSAIRAGYSPKTATKIGAENLTKPDIVEYIERRKKARIERTQITQDFVLEELMKIASANGTDFASVGKRNRVTITPTDELVPEKRAAVASIKKGKNGVELKTYDKLKALELLGKHLGIFDNGAAKTVPDNNLFEAIRDCAKGDYDGISELQQETETDNDLVD